MVISATPLTHGADVTTKVRFPPADGSPSDTCPVDRGRRPITCIITTDNSPVEVRDDSRINHWLRRKRDGSDMVLASFHEQNIICSEFARGSEVADSSAYRWLTELKVTNFFEVEPAS